MLLKFPTGAKKTVNDNFRLHNFIFNVTLQFITVQLLFLNLQA